MQRKITASYFARLASLNSLASSVASTAKLFAGAELLDRRDAVVDRVVAEAERAAEDQDVEGGQEAADFQGFDPHAGGASGRRASGGFPVTGSPPEWHIGCRLLYRGRA